MRKIFVLKVPRRKIRMVYVDNLFELAVGWGCSVKLEPFAFEVGTDASKEADQYLAVVDSSCARCRSRQERRLRYPRVWVGPARSAQSLAGFSRQGHSNCCKHEGNRRPARSANLSAIRIHAREPVDGQEDAIAGHSKNWPRDFRSRKGFRAKKMYNDLAVYL